MIRPYGTGSAGTNLERYLREGHYLQHTAGGDENERMTRAYLLTLYRHDLGPEVLPEAVERLISHDVIRPEAIVPLRTLVANEHAAYLTPMSQSTLDMAETTVRERVSKLYNMANDHQNENPSYWLPIKMMLSYALHGDPEGRNGIHQVELPDNPKPRSR